MFRDKFWWSFALTVPTVIWSPEVQHWLGFTAPPFPGSRFLPAILGTIVFAIYVPSAILWLPKQVMPQAVGCFKNPSGTGYICPG